MAISNLKQFMAYLPYAQYAKLKKYSLKHGINMSQVIRESLDARIDGGDQYLVGFNAGLAEAITAVENNKAAKMRFPSGASFAELVTADINKLKRSGVNVKATDEEVNENQGDLDLGV